MDRFHGQKHLLASFHFALAGFFCVWRQERNLRIHLAAGFLVLTLGGWMRLPRGELVVLFLTVAGVIAAELFNTAIEAAVDLATHETHHLARLAKDTAAAGVLVTALGSAGVGVVIFGPRLGQLGAMLRERWSLFPFGTAMSAAVFLLLVAAVFKRFD